MSGHELATAWWSWIAPVSVQAALLALVVSLFDLVARRRVWPSVRAALWWVVVLRLALPPGVSSPWSVVPETLSAPGIVANESTTTNGSTPGLVLLAGVWLVALVAGVWRELRRENALRAEIASTYAAPAHVERLVERLCERLRVRRTPRLRISERSTSPLLASEWGWWRPTIVLPGAMVGAAFDRPHSGVARRDLALALVHELTHLRRGHALQASLLRALRVVFWFHPAAWIATSRLAELRELVCDAAVTRGRTHQVAHYRDALLRLAGRVQDVPDASNAFFAGSSLLLRLDWLDRRAMRLRALHAPLAAAVFVGACACLLPAPPAAQPLVGLAPQVAHALDRLRRAIASDERQNCLEVQVAAQVLVAHRELTGEDLIATLANDPAPAPSSISPH